jgi:hypothetical protein
MKKILSILILITFVITVQCGKKEKDTTNEILKQLSQITEKQNKLENDLVRKDSTATIVEKTVLSSVEPTKEVEKYVITTLNKDKKKDIKAVKQTYKVAKKKVKKAVKKAKKINNSIKIPKKFKSLQSKIKYLDGKIEYYEDLTKSVKKKRDKLNNKLEKKIAKDKIKKTKDASGTSVVSKVTDYDDED